MTPYQQFIRRCKMRYDFDDQIQVRYQHSDGESFDTWVSGEEVMSRIESDEAEGRLRALKNLNLDALRQLKEDLPEKGKERAWSTLKDQFADSIEESIGGNIIGDSFADSVRGYDDEFETGQDRWLLLLQEPAFRTRVLELAWIQLEGSFPDDDSIEEPDGWI